MDEKAKRWSVEVESSGAIVWNTFTASNVGEVRRKAEELYPDGYIRAISLIDSTLGEDFIDA